MNITCIVNDFLCGVFYTKDSILYYVNKQGNYRNVKFTEAEYQLLKYLSLDIEREEKKFKTLNFVSILMIFACIFGFCFFGNAIILSTKGLTFDNYIKMKILNKTFTNDKIEKTRLFLIDSIKSDYPNITINTSEINVFEVENSKNEYGAVYFTDIFNDNVILVYDNLIDYQAHEIIHHLSNHGTYNGWQTHFSKRDRAINEGMTEYIKTKYLPETRVTYQEKFYIDAIISIFGEEMVMRSYFENSDKEFAKLLNMYSNDFDLLKEIDNDHLIYNNVSEIKEHIIQLFLNYLQQNKQEIVNFDSYVDDFISSIIQNTNQDSYESQAICSKIVNGVLAINDNYVPKKIYLVQS